MNSTLVTLPRSLIGLSASNSAAKEWWASAGVAVSTPAAARRRFLMTDLVIVARSSTVAGSRVLAKPLARELR